MNKQGHILILEKKAEPVTGPEIPKQCPCPQLSGKPISHNCRLITILQSLVPKGELTVIPAGTVCHCFCLIVSEDEPMGGNGRSKEIQIVSEADFKAPRDGDDTDDKFTLF